MLQLRRLLTQRSDWFEDCLQRLAVLDGYGDLSSSLVRLCAHIGRQPVRMVDLADRMGTSRQWIARLAKEGQERGILELIEDPTDGRALMVGFSASGWRVVRMAIARMEQIEAALAQRIGRNNLEQLVAILALDWGESALTDNFAAVEPLDDVAVENAA